MEAHTYQSETQVIESRTEVWFPIQDTRVSVSDTYAEGLEKKKEKKLNELWLEEAPLAVAMI